MNDVNGTNVIVPKNNYPKRKKSDRIPMQSSVFSLEPMLSGVEYIIFDFGNILIDLDIPLAWSQLQQLAGPQYAILSEKWKSDGVFEQYETGALTTDAFLNTLRDDLPEGVSLSAITQAWNSMLIGIPAHRLEMLLRLRRRYRVFLLSNTNALHLEWVYSHLHRDLGVSDFDVRYFDQTFYSHLLGLRKPDREIYEHVLQTIHAAPEKTLFIDDLPENLVEPAKMGIRTFQHDPSVDISRLFP